MRNYITKYIFNQDILLCVNFLDHNHYAVFKIKSSDNIYDIIPTMKEKHYFINHNDINSSKYKQIVNEFLKDLSNAFYKENNDNLFYDRIVNKGFCFSDTIKFDYIIHIVNPHH